MQTIRLPEASCRPRPKSLETASISTRTSLGRRTDTNDLTRSIAALAWDLRNSPGNESVNRIDRGHENSKERLRARPCRKFGIAPAFTMTIGLAGHCRYLSRARPSPAVFVSASICNRDRAPDAWHCRMNSIVASKASSALAFAIPDRTGLIRLAASKPGRFSLSNRDRSRQVMFW